MLPKKIDLATKLWLIGKTIAKVKVVRPTEEEREMYERPLGPMALRITFTDGSAMVLDTWIGEYKPKKSTLPKGKRNLRSRPYFTISRKES
jgi:hypothetical protein